MSFLHIDLASLIKTIGYFGLFGLVFSESGLLIGVFLPGDSVLFTAGFLASQGYLSIGILLLIIFFGAISGDNVGYVVGRKVGPLLFKKDESLIFSKRNVDKAKAFFEKYGGKTIMFARFIPVIRTFSPMLAGVGQMRYLLFIIYDLLGGLFWSLILTLGGYYLGKAIPGIDRYLLPIVLIIILVSISPTLIHFLKGRRQKTNPAKP